MRNKELCMLAVLHGEDLETEMGCIPEKLRTEEFYFNLMDEICIDDLSYILEYIPDKVKTYEFCMKAVSDYYSSLMFVPEKHISEDMCVRAIKKDFREIQFVPDKFKNDEYFLIRVVNNHNNFYDYIKILKKIGEYDQYTRDILNIIKKFTFRYSNFVNKCKHCCMYFPFMTRFNNSPKLTKNILFIKN